MRTTILIDDQLGRRFREAARKRGQSLSAFLAEAGRRHLAEGAAGTPEFVLLTRGGSGLVAGVDLDRVNAFVAEDDEAGFSGRP